MLRDRMEKDRKSRDVSLESYDEPPVPIEPELQAPNEQKATRAMSDRVEGKIIGSPQLPEPKRGPLAPPSNIDIFYRHLIRELRRQTAQFLSFSKNDEGDGIDELILGVERSLDENKVKAERFHRSRKTGEGLHSKFIGDLRESLVKYLDAWQAERDLIDLHISYLKSKDDSQKSNVTERLHRLLIHGREHGDDGLEDLAKSLFPEWSFVRPVHEPTSPPFTSPTEAPELYQGLRGPETPPAFVQRVYGECLGHGLTRAHIRNLDPGLYRAIENWSRRNEWPAEVDLPTKAEQTTREIAAFEAQVLEGNSNEVLGKFTGQEAARLGAAIARRTK